MSYQFIHMETYSRKPNKQGQSTSFVLDEAMRVPSASHHVTSPLPPVQLYGMSVPELRELHDRLATEARTTNAKGQTRSIRKDQHTLMTMVISHPGVGDVEQWQEDSISWLKERYGSELKTVVRHDDETYPHLHAYVIADDLKAKNLHPGAVAKAEAIAAGQDNKAGDRAYRKAMREWQDDYWQRVGMKNGLARIGPGVRRLTHAQWKAEKAAGEAVRKAHDFAKEVEQKTLSDAARNAEIIAAAQREVNVLRAAAIQAAEEAKAAQDLAIREREKVGRWYHDARKKLIAFKDKLVADRDKLAAERRELEQQRKQVAQERTLGARLRGRLLGWLEASPKSIRRAAERDVEARLGAKLRAADSERYKARAESAQNARRNTLTQEVNQRLLKENEALRHEIEELKPKQKTGAEVEHLAPKLV